MIRKIELTKNKEILNKIVFVEFELEISILELVGYSFIRLKIKTNNRIKRYQ
jgi:hypothetical protein